MRFTSKSLKPFSGLGSALAALRSARHGALFLALGAVAAFTLAVPATAQAAVSSSAQAAATPAISPSDCFSSFGLFSYYYGEFAYATAIGSDLGFGVQGDQFCQALASGSSIVEIFDKTVGGDGCLALNSTAQVVYLHNSSGCDEGTAGYLLWKFNYIKSITVNGTAYKIYELQSQYGDQPCLLPSNPAKYATCNPGYEQQWVEVPS